MKKETGIAKKKQYQKLGKVYEFDKKEKDETKNIDKTKNKKHVKSNLFYSNKFTFFKCRNFEKVSNLSFSSKQKDLNEFKAKL